MSIIADKRSIDNALQLYRQKLDEIPDEQFNATPPGGGWSYAEVYSHIMQATLATMMAVEKCSNGTAQISRKPLSLRARIIFLMGQLPPVKIKAPASIAAVTVNISKEEARNLIIKVKKRVDELVPAVSESSKYYKIKHPRLGMLNAKQWFTFANYHITHHLKQLLRIQKKFGKS